MNLTHDSLIIEVQYLSVGDIIFIDGRPTRITKIRPTAGVCPLFTDVYVPINRWYNGQLIEIFRLKSAEPS